MTRDDIACIRMGLQLSQRAFATMLGIPTATLQNWEHGRTRPDAPAVSLLRIALKRPDVITEVIGGKFTDRRRKSEEKGEQA